MKIKWLLLVIFLIILISLVFIFYPKSKVCFKETCFKVDIADTSKEREEGLMFRSKLDQDKGMLFIYPGQGEYSFWMKNTLIPLDIIWIDVERKVVYMSKNTQPCVEDFCSPINPSVLSQYVLEINSGMVDRMGLKIGDKLEIR